MRTFAVTMLAVALYGADELPLIQAAHENDLSKVEKLLSGKADVRAANTYGVTALLEAAQNGNSEIVARLLKAGADSNTGSKQGQTPLMAAARSGNAATVDLLLKAGAAAGARESWKGQTAMMWAAAANQADVVRVLAKAGADLNAHSTIWPVKPKKKEDGNLVSNPPRGGLTALLFAARQGSLAAVRSLIEAGANLNLAEPDGISPTVMALINGHYDVAALLLEAGADPNIADHWGRATLYAAVDMHTMEPSSTRPNPKSNDAKSAFDVAVLALMHGAKVDVALIEATPGRSVADFPDPILGTGTTPFIRAAKTGDVATMRLLLENGANPKSTTKQGVNALMAASGLGWRFGDSAVPEADGLAAVKLCLDLGLDPNAADEKGRTALQGAAERGGNQILQTLVQRGARLDVKDKSNRTPLDVAKGRDGGNPKYPETVELLTKLAGAQ